MIFRIQIPTNVEVQLEGCEMRIIGPKETKEFDGSKRDCGEYNIKLEWDEIVITPKEKDDLYQVVNCFHDSLFIESMLESVRNG